MFENVSLNHYEIPVIMVFELERGTLRSIGFQTFLNRRTSSKGTLLRGYLKTKQR